MADYTNKEEYWDLIEQRYGQFSRPDDPVEVTDSYRTEGRCYLCGHEIVNNFEIVNRRTGEVIVVGSHCINNRLKIEKKWFDKIKAQKRGENGTEQVEMRT